MLHQGAGTFKCNKQKMKASQGSSNCRKSLTITAYVYCVHLQAANSYQTINSSHGDRGALATLIVHLESLAATKDPDGEPTIGNSFIFYLDNMNI